MSPRGARYHLGSSVAEIFLLLIENSIFYTFCIFSWPQIANGDTGKGNLSRGDAHVNGSSRRAHEVASSATWHMPGGVEYFKWL